MPMRNLSVLQAKRLGVYTIGPDEDLMYTARKMQEHNVSALVVTDGEGYLTGVISRTDLVKACLQHSDWSHLRVRDCMSATVVTVELDDPMLRVMELLVDHHIHRVVAVEFHNGKPKPMAVLSAADVVYHMVQKK
jgi:CBS domain-containing protein